MKTLKGWDQYVQEAKATNDTNITLPLADGETYIINYPSREQGKAIAAAQRIGDMDELLVALLGAEAGARVAELSANEPGFVLEALLLDVLAAFGFVTDLTAEAAATGEVDAGKSSTTPEQDTPSLERGESAPSSYAG